MEANLKVFCFLCFLEASLSLSSSLNIFFFMDPNEPQPQIIVLMFFFGVFTATSIQILYILTQKALSIKFEAFSASFGFTVFILASIMSMVAVEHDKHLESMTDKEELAHPFFLISRVQSVQSLVTAMIFLMHTTFAIDFISNPSDNLSISSDSSDDYHLQKNSLKFFFECIWVTIK